MKKVFLLTMIAAIISTTAFSQTLTTAPQDSKQTPQTTTATEWEKKVADELKLSEEQITKWEALNKSYKARIEALKNDATLDKDVLKEKKMELKKEKEKYFLQLLSPEQQTKYNELIEMKKKEAEKSKQSGS